MKKKNMHSVQKKSRCLSAILTFAMLLSLAPVNTGFSANAAISVSSGPTATASSGSSSSAATAANVIAVSDTDHNGELSHHEIEDVMEKHLNSKPCQIIISDNIKSIGEGAFYPAGEAWPDITSITIPESVIEIGDNAFVSCNGLASLTIPASVKKIGDQVFNYCESLKALNVEEGNSVYASKDNIIYSKDFQTLYYGAAGVSYPDLVLPNQVTTIGDSALIGCKLGTVTLPAGLKTIGDSAFCDSTLKNIQLPEGLTKIGGEAFSNCTSLKINVTLPKSITSYGVNVFRNSGVVGAVINSNINISQGLFESTNIKTLVINGQVKKIGDSAFEGCEQLTKVTLPKTLKSIGDDAFNDCKRLAGISLPSALTTIGIKGAKNDEGIVKDSIGELSTAFAECKSLKTIAIPNSVTYIGSGCFSDCTSLKSVSLPKNKKYNIVSVKTFSGCTSLSSVVIPKNIVTIGDSAFYRTGLTKLTIQPNGCKYICEFAFEWTKLKDLVLPVGVVRCDNRAFSQIKTLKTITLSSTIPILAPYIFQELPNLIRVNLLSLHKIPIGEFNFEDALFVSKGAIHAPKNFKDAYKDQGGVIRMSGRKLIMDLPAIK